MVRKNARIRLLALSASLAMGIVSAAAERGQDTFGRAHYVWIEAERFSTVSPNARRRLAADRCTGLRGPDREDVSQNEVLELRAPGAWARYDATTSVAGRYVVWSRSEDGQIARPYEIEMAGKRFHANPKPAGKRGTSWAWHRVGEAVLPQGSVTIVARKLEDKGLVRLDCLLLTDDLAYIPKGIERTCWLSEESRLVRVDMRGGFPGRPAGPSAVAPELPEGAPQGPADYLRTLFVYPYTNYYVLEYDEMFWGKKRHGLEFRLPHIEGALREIIVYPPPRDVFVSARARLRGARVAEPVASVRHGVLSLRGDFDLSEGGTLSIHSDDKAGPSAELASVPLRNMRVTQTPQGCEVRCPWGTLGFDPFGRLCSIRLKRQRAAYDFIDAPLDCSAITRGRAHLTVQRGIETETGWEQVRLTFRHRLPDRTEASLVYTISEDSFVTFAFSVRANHELNISLGWDMSDRFGDLWYIARGPLGTSRYGLNTFSGKRRYVEIDKSAAQELIPEQNTQKALSLELIDGANCHFGVVPRFFDGNERVHVSRDRAIAFRVRAREYSNVFMLDFYPTTNYNPRRLFAAGTGGIAVNERYDPCRPMRPFVYVTARPGGLDRFRPFLATHLMPLRDISRWGDWNILLRPNQYARWRDRLSQYGVEAGHYYQNNPAIQGTMWSPYVRRDRTCPIWLGGTSRYAPPRMKLCMASPYWERLFWQVMDAVQSRGEKFVYFDAFLPALCESRSHAHRNHLALYDIVRFLRRLRANAPDALVILHGHPSVNLFAYRRYAFYMPGEGGAGKEGELVNESELAPFEWGATCYVLLPQLDERGIGYYWSLVKKLTLTGNHPFPFRTVMNYRIPSEPNWEAMTQNMAVPLQYGSANAMYGLVRVALANMKIEAIDRADSGSILGVKQYTCYRGDICGLPVALIMICDEDGEVRLNPRVWGGELVLVEPATQRRLAQTTGGHVGVPLRTLRRVWGPRAPVPICVFDRRLMNIDLSLGREGDRVRVVVTNRTGVALKTERLLLRNERELLEPRIVSLRDQEAHTYEFRVPSVKQQGLSARLLGCVARPNSSAERRGDAGKP